jgi:hypothetical protein
MSIGILASPDFCSPVSGSKITTDVYMQAVGHRSVRCAKPLDQASEKRRRFGSQAQPSGSNGIMKKSGGLVEVTNFVGVPLVRILNHLNRLAQLKSFILRFGLRTEPINQPNF